jgi:hypothetical protein
MLPLVLLVMWVFILPKPEIINTENAFPLFLSLLRYLAQHRNLIILLSLLLVVLQAYFLSVVINRHSVLKENSNLPALLYVVFMSCFPEQLTFNPLLFTNFFIILFLNAQFHFYRADSAVFQVFDAGFFVGIAALFYWPSMFLFPLIWAALIILRPFEWREWIASLVGLVLPFIFFAAVLYWFDMMSVSSVESILQPFYKVQFSTVYNNTYIILFAILTLIVMASLVSFSKELGSFAKLRTRRYLTLMIWFFMFAALSYLISVKKSMVSLSFLAIPFAVLVSNYFLSLRNRIIAEVIFLVLLAAVIYNQVLYFLTFYPV